MFIGPMGSVIYSRYTFIYKEIVRIVYMLKLMKNPLKKAGRSFYQAVSKKFCRSYSFFFMFVLYSIMYIFISEFGGFYYVQKL